MSTTAPRAYVSYYAESVEHVDQVRSFAALLRSHGIDARMDIWAGTARLDRPLWSLNELRAADRVLVIASPTYRRVGDDGVAVAEMADLAGELAALRDLVHGDRDGWLPRIVPVLLPGRDIVEVPVFMQARTAGAIRVAELTSAGVRPLLRELTGSPEHLPPRLGPALPDVVSSAVVVTPDSAVYQALGVGVLSETEARGTLFELVAPGRSAFWLGQIAETDPAAATHVERVAARFAGLPILLVGTAVGLSGVRAGHVVVADHVYGYDSAHSADDGDRAQIKTAAPAHRLLQRAQAVARTQVRAVVGPVATGAKRITGRWSPAAAWIADHCADALAADSCAYGFLHAASAAPDVEALAIHGITSRLGARTARAAAPAAAAFATALIDSLTGHR
ncbi:SEFIR domain-containing protein [Actinokineospora sp. 24-640]